MTKETQAVFSDSATLRAKLSEFLKTPEKTELYARAAELFFDLGYKTSLKFSPTWSWWALFAGGWFFVYRKDYLHSIILLLLTSFFGGLCYLYGFWAVLGGSVCFAISLYSAVTAKYRVIKNFENSLDYDRAATLEYLSGTNKWVIWLAIAILALFILSIVLTGIFISSLR